MKNKLKVIFAAVLIFTITASGFRAFAAETAENTKETLIEYSEEFAMVAENNDLALFVKSSNGEFSVLEKSTGKTWYSNPAGRETDDIATGINKTNLNSQLFLTYVGSSNNEEVTNSRVGSERKSGIKVYKTQNGFQASYEFPDIKITIPVTVSLDKDSLVVAVPTDKIKEKSEFKLYTLAVYPYFGAGGMDDKGYLFVPDGSGAIINYNNKKNAFDPYKGTVYGEDIIYNTQTSSTVKKQVYLPVFGGKTGDSAYVAIMEKGEEYGYINAFVSGTISRYNSAYPSYQLRRDYSFSIPGGGDVKLYDKEKIVFNEIQTRYYFLKDQDANYSGMAQKVREYAISKMGAKEKEMKNSLFLTVTGSVLRQAFFLGIPYQKNTTLTTYKQLSKILEELKAENINNITVNYNRSTKSTINEKISATIEKDSLLGSSNSFNKLLKQENTEILISPSMNLYSFKKDGNGISKFFNAAREPSNAPNRQYTYKRSTFYVNEKISSSLIMSPVKFEDIAMRLSESNQKKKIPALSVGSFSNALYSDFGSKTTGRNTAQAKVTDALSNLRKGFGKITGEAPNFYALPYLDAIFDMPVSSSRYFILDEDVPFLQMVAGGISSYASQPLNLEENPKTALLKAMETGSCPSFSIINDIDFELRNTAANELFSCQFGQIKGSLVSTYKEFEAVFQETEGARILNHNYLQAGVAQTTYSNGVSVVVNYSDKPVTAGSQTVPQNSYLVLKGA